ncbi:hypothetical protein [Cyclobacterium amurskyense]|uniref:Uncharacterized protein n=1 Tax=Cyclobacterium amurskyense TaxID=320787 RepID=A0A0H4P5S7_9BACT|nr:hypothetical protein [Cyclobacterium amurskyense]AKP49791.1 hypothetical protein CA2015_0311 [Cyclobacterium amurskyense]|tara:strand:+ start:1024 stop:1494 length:471 start_codon:yes stop_codon:yes gene_type:complete
MSTKNTVSIQIPEAELQTVKEAIATLKTTLSPYLIAISAEERQRIPKMGDGTIPFVEKVMDYAQEDSQFLPPFIDLNELSKDWEVVKRLAPLLRDLQQVESNLNDTVMMAGSEAYVGALGYYNSVKYGARVNVADAKVIHEDLKQRFNRSKYNQSE